MPRRKASPSAEQAELDFASAAPTPELEAGPLDKRFAELLLRLNGDGCEPLARVASGVSAARAAGESCLALSALGADVGTMRRSLLASKVVGEPGAWRPLILDAQDRVYLQRYWEYEQRLAQAIAARVMAPPPAVDEALLQGELAREFTTEKSRDQRRAAEVAIRSHFTIITGGPGTGKTRTVGVILALLAKLAAAAGRPAPRLALAAPTGKAAMRLQESIRQVRPELAAVEAVTLHRLLGLVGDTPKPRHDAAHPLAVDLVVVDEASMVDLAMMAKLLAAVPKHARILLLGDRDQLPPVETGHVFGDLCETAALAAHTAPLRQNFRFPDESGIKLLSDAIQAGDAAAVLAHLGAGELPGLRASETMPPDALGAALREPIRKGFAPLFENLANPAAALAALGEFRLLCALREGPYGVENLNRLAENALAEAGLIVTGQRHYAGRPVMVLRNDYQLRLFNGDIGLILHDAEAGGELRAFFPDVETGAIRRLSPARLPEHETAWAMTVHKSQGSEFQKILLVLPDRESPVATRELFYTAITRARREAEIWYRPAPLRAALQGRAKRTSGLADAIAAHHSARL